MDTQSLTNNDVGLLRRFLSSPAGKKVAVEAETEQRSERQAKLDRIAELDSQRAEKQAAAHRDLEVAEAALKEADEARFAAFQKHADACGRVAALAPRNGLAGALELELRTSLPAESAALLSAFNTEMLDLLVATRKEPTDERRERKGFNPFGRQWGEVVHTNVESRNEKLKAIEAARRAAQELWLSADVSPMAIAARLDELRATIPQELELRFSHKVDPRGEREW
jgi:hypothetical protein